MIFRASSLRFEFEARDEVRFPRGKAGNTIRGALGMALPEALFAPRGEGPSGLRDLPRPFALRTSGLDGKRFEPGERFELRANVFADEAREALREALQGLAVLGPHRSRIAFVRTHLPDRAEIDLAATTPADRLLIRFLTPMELKFEDGTLRQPRFDALFARVRDRVSTLCTVWQGGAPHLDYRAMGERAKAVVMTNCRVEQVEVERRSTRTGQRHGLGGFIGEAEYTGDLGEFVPWLRAAEWTGAGRYTVWGNGALRVAVVTGDHVAVERDAGR